jgi:TRAP-type mannitol/chloroaromatic compound transport system permease small subunit
VVGKFSMYLVFMMIFILLYEPIARNFFDKSCIWAVEMAQFTMAAYYLLGGGYSMILRGHVRMDLLYGRWSDKKKALMDCHHRNLFDFLSGVSLLIRRLFQHRIRRYVRAEKPVGLGALHGTHQDHHGYRRPADAAAGRCDLFQRSRQGKGGEDIT